METENTLRAEDGTALYYRLTATPGAPKPLMILIHGLASNGTRWSEFVEHTSLTASWDLLRPDLRGHGYSFTRRGVGMRAWLSDLEEILDHEKRSSALIVGHSLGAQVALNLASRHPDRVMALALIDPVFPRAVHGHRRLQARFHVLLPPLGGLIRLANCLGMHRRYLPTTRDLRALDESTRAELLANGNHQEMVRRYSSARLDLRSFATANYLREVYEMFRPLPPLERITCPVLVLQSQGVTWCDPDAALAEIRRLPRVEHQTIDAFHWPLTERPREVREAIERWCNDLRSTPQGLIGTNRR